MKRYLKFHFYNLGLALMEKPETTQKGLEYIQCVVQILKETAKCPNALELLCNSLVNSSVRGDEEAAVLHLISMQNLGFSDQEILSTLMEATNGIEFPANLIHNAGCLWHAQAYEHSSDGTNPREEELSHAEVMLKRPVKLQLSEASHHVELCMFFFTEMIVLRKP